MSEKRFINIKHDIAQAYIQHDLERNQFVVFGAIREVVPVLKVATRHRTTPVYLESGKTYRLNRFDDKRDPHKWALANGFAEMLLHSQAPDHEGTVYRMVNPLERIEDADMLQLAPAGTLEFKWQWVRTSLLADRAARERLIMNFHRLTGRV